MVAERCSAAARALERRALERASRSGAASATSTSAPVNGCVEAQPVRVEELPLETEVAGDAVDRVAADGQPDRLEVDADLVRPPRLEPHLEQRVLGEELDAARTT